MKKRFLVGVLVIVALLTGTGCSATDSPKEVAQEFVKALVKKDTKAAAELLTPETAEEMARVPAYVIQEWPQRFGNGKFKTATETIEDDEAVVTFTLENGLEDSINLIKVNGKWKVSTH